MKKAGWKYKLEASFLEIYNETIRYSERCLFTVSPALYTLKSDGVVVWGRDLLCEGKKSEDPKVDFKNLNIKHDSKGVVRDLSPLLSIASVSMCPQ